MPLKVASVYHGERERGRERERCKSLLFDKTVKGAAAAAAMDKSIF